MFSFHPIFSTLQPCSIQCFWAFPCVKSPPTGRKTLFPFPACLYPTLPRKFSLNPPALAAHCHGSSEPLPDLGSHCVTWGARANDRTEFIHPRHTGTHGWVGKGDLRGLGSWRVLRAKVTPSTVTSVTEQSRVPARPYDTVVTCKSVQDWLSNHFPLLASVSLFEKGDNDTRHAGLRDNACEEAGWRLLFLSHTLNVTSPEAVSGDLPWCPSWLPVVLFPIFNYSCTGVLV